MPTDEHIVSSSDIIDEAQARLTEAVRQLASWNARYQEQQHTLGACTQALASIGRPILQDEPAAAEALAAAHQTLTQAAQSVPETLHRMHTSVTLHLTQAHRAVEALLEAWEKTAVARPSLDREEKVLQQRLRGMQRTLAAAQDKAEAEHQERLAALRADLDQVEGQIAEAKRLREQLTAL